MSVIKKGIKKAFKWVKKNWKYIVIAAAIVFTAGIATVGVAGFSSAAAAAGGGVGGFLSAAGSTMVAGVASIGGTVGIGSGVTATTAGGAFAAAPVMSGVASGAGLTLGTGAAAQGLGFAASTSGGAAPAAALGGGPPAALAGQAGSTATAAGGVTSVAAPAGAAGTAGAAAPAAAGGFMSSPNSGPLLQAGIGLLGAYSNARSEDEQWERTKPRGLWGVGLNGEEDAPMEHDDFQGQVYDPRSFQNPNAQNQSRPPAPQGGLIGNAALTANRQINPNMRNPLSPDYDPALARINRGATYG